MLSVPRLLSHHSVRLAFAFVNLNVGKFSNISAILHNPVFDGIYNGLVKLFWLVDKMDDTVQCTVGNQRRGVG